MKIVKSGSLRKPDRIMLYGQEGIGKSTWPTKAQTPLFLDLEDGLAHLDVPCVQCRTFDEVTAAIKQFPANEYKTLVLDTLDGLESLILDHLKKKNGWASIEAPGYGKGYVAVAEEFLPVLTMLDDLREKGVEVVLIAHAKVSNFANPAGPDYSRYEPKVEKRVSALVKEWADVVLFACHEETVTAKGNANAPDAKGKARGTGNRIVYSEHRPAWDAKNRHGLPETFKLDYAEFDKLRNGTKPSTATPKATPPSKAAPAAKPAQGLALKDVQDAFREYMKLAKVNMGDFKKDILGEYLNVKESKDIPESKFAECLELIGTLYQGKGINPESAPALNAAAAKLAHQSSKAA